ETPGVVGHASFLHGALHRLVDPPVNQNSSTCPAEHPGNLLHHLCSLGSTDVTDEEFYRKRDLIEVDVVALACQPIGSGCANATDPTVWQVDEVTFAEQRSLTDGEVDVASDVGSDSADVPP